MFSFNAIFNDDMQVNPMITNSYEKYRENKRFYFCVPVKMRKKNAEVISNVGKLVLQMRR
jgi:malate/lactate dehydrogenase